MSRTDESKLTYRAEVWSPWTKEWVTLIGMDGEWYRYKSDAMERAKWKCWFDYCLTRVVNSIGEIEQEFDPTVRG